MTKNPGCRLLPVAGTTQYLHLQEVHAVFLTVDLCNPLGCVSKKVSSVDGSVKCVQSFEYIQVAWLSCKVSCCPAYISYQAGSGSILYQEMDHLHLPLDRPWRKKTKLRLKCPQWPETRSNPRRTEAGGRQLLRHRCLAIIMPLPSHSSSWEAAPHPYSKETQALHELPVFFLEWPPFCPSSQLLLKFIESTTYEQSLKLLQPQ